MSLKKITALILAVVIAAFVAGCSPKAETPAASDASSSPVASASAESTAVTVTDMTGKEIKLDKPAEKIVALTASDCEIIYALGAGSTLVGRGEYCDYPAEVSSITSVQSGSDTNIEQIISLKPDVVIMSTMAQTEDQVTSLENAGIKVVMSDAQNIEGVYTAITMIGQVVGKNDEAKSVVESMKKTFEELKAKVPADSAKTIYFEVSPLEYGLYTAGTGTFMDEIATMLGLKNIFSDMESWAQVSEEQVIERNPDYIITTSMSFGDSTMNPLDEIKSRKGWDGITAIKDGQLYNADSSAITRPGPRLAEAATELYNFVYGNTEAATSPTT